MKVSIFGLGYVGCVNAACLAKLGHDIIGVDIDISKVDLINSHKPTIHENGLEDLFLDNSERIRATTSIKEGIDNSEVSLLCIGTPSTETGTLNMNSLYKVCENIGRILKEKSSYHLIMVRSTVTPGTINNLVNIIESSSGKSVGEDFNICLNPEFLREGQAINDFLNPPFTLIGCDKVNENFSNSINTLYSGLSSQMIVENVPEVEIIKMVNNSWHALKIVFANEVSEVCRSYNIDPYKVMDIFKKDTILNISPKYLNPGFSYGGSCLPKDLGALSYFHPRKNNLFSCVAERNSDKIRKVYEYLKAKKRLPRFSDRQIKLLFLGLSFKEGTDDVRKSPVVELIECLRGWEVVGSFSISVHDINVKNSITNGTNSKFILPQLNGIENFLVDDLKSSISNSDIIIYVNREIYYKDIGNFLLKGQTFLQLNKFNGVLPDNIEIEELY
jgi:GDP-mannose 6-dehydrogenase